MTRTQALLVIIPIAIVLAAIGWLVVYPQVWFWNYEPREGDVLFQSLPRGSLVIAIEGSTHSPWSHCGIVAKEGDEWVVYEAYEGVSKVPLREFWSRSRSHQFAVYRFKPEHQKHVPAMFRYVHKQMGLPYDAKYEMDDEKIYCSELIYKAYLDAAGEPLGKLVALGDLDWKPYEATIRRIEGGAPPLERKMITPRDLAEAEQLELIRAFGIGR